MKQITSDLSKGPPSESRAKMSSGESNSNDQRPQRKTVSVAPKKSKSDGKTGKDGKIDLSLKSPDGKYTRTDNRLGKGGYKRVYLAIERGGREVAWNVCSFGGMRAKQKQKVKKEVEILKETKHKNIMDIYDCWETNSDLYFVTEKAAGTCAEYIKNLHPVAMPTIRDWCTQILLALDYLHTRSPPIMHRDLKAENVFVASDGTIRLGDFGLALEAGNFDSKCESLNGPPEMLSKDPPGTKVDMFAFGLLALEMRTNRKAYEQEELMKYYLSLDDKKDPKETRKLPSPVCLDEKNFDFEPKRMNKLFRELICSCIKYHAEDRPTAGLLLQHPFFNPKLFEIHNCKVKISSENPDIIQLELETNIPSRRKTATEVNLKTESIRQIAEEFANSFKKEIETEYPDSVEQDIPDTINECVQKKIRDIKAEAEREEGQPKKTMGNFKIVKIEVNEKKEGLEVVQLKVWLLVDSQKTEIDCDYNFQKDTHTKVATKILENFKEDKQKYHYVTLLSNRIRDALKEHREVFYKKRDLDTKMGLEEMLGKAGITDEKIIKEFFDQAIKVEDLTDGSLTEEDLRSLVPQLGPRRRLTRNAQSQKAMKSDVPTPSPKEQAPIVREGKPAPEPAPAPTPERASAQPVLADPSTPNTPVSTVNRTSAVPAERKTNETITEKVAAAPEANEGNAPGRPGTK